jgi:hypothetical protein
MLTHGGSVREAAHTIGNGTAMRKHADRQLNHGDFELLAQHLLQFRAVDGIG